MTDLFLVASTLEMTQFSSSSETDLVGAALPTVPTVPGSGNRPFSLPEGCKCSIQYPSGEGSGPFDWRYALDCPVDLKDHPMHRFEFGMAYSMGFGFASVSGHGTVTFGNGAVSTSSLDAVSR